MKKFLISQIIIILISVVIGFLGALAIDFNFEFNADNLTSVLKSSTFYIVAIVAYLVIICVSLLTKKPKSEDSNKGGGNEGKTASGDKINEYADSRWVTEKELMSEKKFRFFKYSQLKNCKEDGIVIRSAMDKSGNDISVNMYAKDVHALIVGASGSGKTQNFVNPTIQIWTSCASKPSIVISDPKGELYGFNSQKCKKSGYNVVTLDLRNPYQSSRWNPMTKPYQEYQRALHLEKEVKKMVGGRPSASEYKIMDEEYSDTWYAFNGVAYPNETQLKKDISSMRNELISKAQIALKEFAMALCPIKNKQDPSWEQGAQNFLTGLMLAMLEDSSDPNLGMTEEKYCPYNLAKIATTIDSGDDEYASLKNYLLGRPKESIVMALCGTALFNAPGTTRSYMGIVKASLELFQDNGVNYITSGTDIDLSKIATEPTALFLLIPDEQKSRHSIATVFISQLYQALIEQANKSISLKLPRNVYFLLDEFANLPELPNFSQLITVGRSRRIFFCMIIQSYTQLDTVYGEANAKTIKDNANMKIYIGTDDQKTKEEFSKLCGDISLSIRKENTSKDKDGKTTGKSFNTETKQRPLIYPDELGHLEPGVNIVKIFNEYPIKSKFTPSWQCAKAGIFDMAPPPDVYIPKGYFDAQNMLYDFTKRNKARKSSFDDLFN